MRAQGLTSEGLKAVLLSVHARDPQQPEFLQVEADLQAKAEVQDLALHTCTSV